eukprot:gene4856-34615_t
MVSSNSGGDGVSSSTLSSVATMFKATVGAGVLSLPYAFKEAGFTLYVLAKFAERYGRQSYTQLVRATLGKKLSASLPLLLVLFSFGDCIAFMMITGDAFSALARGYLGDDSILGDRQMVMIVIAVVAMLPMCLAKATQAVNQTHFIESFGSSSTLKTDFENDTDTETDPGTLFCVRATLAVNQTHFMELCGSSGTSGYSGRQPDPLDGIVWLKATQAVNQTHLMESCGSSGKLKTDTETDSDTLFCYRALWLLTRPTGWNCVPQGYSGRQPDPLDGIVWLKWDIGVLYALPIIVFGFNCHTNIITIFQELKDEPDSILRRSGSM